MHNNQKVIEQFYSSFQKRDFEGMKACYHDAATFSDPVFPKLDSKKAKAMWHMFCIGRSGLTLQFNSALANENTGSCHWEANYTFTRTGRPVLNKINAAFKFKDGKIIEHVDTFDFWKWSRMALGTPGILLGWSPLIKNKVRKIAAGNLAKFIDEHAEYK